MVGGVRVPVGQAPSSRGSALREVGSSSLLARRSPVVPKAGAGWRPAAPEAGVRGCDRRTGRPGPLCVEKAPVWAAVGGIRLPRICCCARGEGPPPTLESLQCALASSNSTTRPTPTLPSPPPHQPVPGPLARSVAISARTGRFSPGWLAVPCRGTLAGKGPAVKRGRAAGGGGAGRRGRAGASGRRALVPPDLAAVPPAGVGQPSARTSDGGPGGRSCGSARDRAGGAAGAGVAGPVGPTSGGVAGQAPVWHRGRDLPYVPSAPSLATRLQAGLGQSGTASQRPPRPLLCFARRAAICCRGPEPETDRSCPSLLLAAVSHSSQATQLARARPSDAPRRPTSNRDPHHPEPPTAPRLAARSRSAAPLQSQPVKHELHLPAHLGPRLPRGPSSTLAHASPRLDHPRACRPLRTHPT